MENRTQKVIVALSAAVAVEAVAATASASLDEQLQVRQRQLNRQQQGLDLQQLGLRNRLLQIQQRRAAIASQRAAIQALRPQPVRPVVAPRQRPAPDSDLWAMPAGTLYDVVRQGDL